MNNDLISRSALIDAVDEIDWYSINEESGKLMQGAESSVSAWFKASEIYEALLSAPAVDAVEVCRCEYCNKGHPELGMDGCVWCVRYGRDMNLDDFCSYGERK